MYASGIVFSRFGLGSSRAGRISDHSKEKANREWRIGKAAINTRPSLLAIRARQNASAANSIVVAQPVWMRARCTVVSGSIRSMKKRPVTSLVVRYGVAPLAAILSWATLAIFAHI